MYTSDNWEHGEDDTYGQINFTLWECRKQSLQHELEEC